MRFYWVSAVLVILVMAGCGGPPGPLNDIGGGGSAVSGSTVSFVYIANAGSNSVSGYAIDPTTGALGAVPGSPFATPNPAALALDGTGRYLTVVGKSGVSVIGIDPKTGGLLDLHCIDDEVPHAPTAPCYPFHTNSHGTPQFVTAQGETLDIGNTGTDDISVFVQDPANGDLGTSIPSEFQSGVRGLLFLEFSGNKLWAAGDSGLALLAPCGICVRVAAVLDNSRGYRAAALHNSGNFLYAIDTDGLLHDFCLRSTCFSGKENQAPLPSPGGASSIAVQGNFAYVTHSESADIAIYSISPGSCSGNTCTGSGALTFAASMPAGLSPRSARVFLGKFLYVANRGDGTVSGFRINRNGLLTAVPGSPFTAGTTPTFIASPQ